MADRDGVRELQMRRLHAAQSAVVEPIIAITMSDDSDPKPFLAALGRGIRPWKIAATATALTRAFPGVQVRHEGRIRGRSGQLFSVRGGVLRRRRVWLLFLPAFFDRCADEDAVAAAIAEIVKQWPRRSKTEQILEVS